MTPSGAGRGNPLAVAGALARSTVAEARSLAALMRERQPARDTQEPA